jgi:hypothetical protein
LKKQKWNAYINWIIPSAQGVPKRPQEITYCQETEIT